jgi:DNA primase
MKVNVVSLPGGDDPDTFLQKHGKGEFDVVLRASVRIMDFVLAQVVKIGSSAPIEERMDTAKEMAVFVEKIPDSNIQNFYINKIIDALGIDEARFRQERFAEKKASGGVKDKTLIPALKPQAEEMLLHLILKDEGIDRDLRKQIRAEDFTDPLYRRTAARIFEVLDADGTLDISTLLRDEDEELKNLISHYAVLDRVYEDPAKSFQDCVALIKQKDPEKKMQSLAKAIREAEARGDREEYVRLYKEQQELSRRPGRKIPGKSGTSTE